MSNNEQYKLQSYFESICNSFYIAYTQVKRLEMQIDSIESQTTADEYKIVNKILEISSEEGDLEKYITQKYTIEELQKKKKELEESINQNDQKKIELDAKLCFWTNCLWKKVKEITQVIGVLKDEGYKLIITSQEEIIALIAFYNEYKVSDYRIIDDEEKSLKDFPSDKKMYQEFFMAYCLEDDEKMREVYKKYF